MNFSNDLSPHSMIECDSQNWITFLFFLSSNEIPTKTNKIIALFDKTNKWIIQNWWK